MESKILTNRVKELMEEQQKADAVSQPIKLIETGGFSTLEKIAASLNLLPLVLHSEGNPEPETGGLDEYLYGKEIPAGNYLAAVVRSKMRQHRLSQAVIAKRIRAAPSTLSMILSGDRQPHIGTLEKICSAVGLTPSYLVPKRTGVPPLRVYEESFKRVTEVLREYLHSILSGNEIPLTDLHQAIEYGAGINELTAALRVKYNLLRDSKTKEAKP